MKENWTYKRIIATILITITAIWMLFKPAAILGILSKVNGVLEPFIIGACIAFVMNELLKLIENGWCKVFSNSTSGVSENLMRPVCLVLSFIGVCAIFTLLVFIIIPELSATIKILKDSFPTYVDGAEKLCNEVVAYLNRHGFDIESKSVDFNIIKQKASETVTAERDSIINGAISATSSLFSLVVDVVMAVVFAIFILADKEKLSSQFDRLFRKAFSEERYNKLVDILDLTNKAFSNFVTGQLTEACIIGCLCFVGMLILDMPYAGAISVLVGFTALIPMVGAFLGTGVGAFMIFFVEPIKALWFIIFIIVLQQFEGNLIYPKVVGKSVGLPGIWVLFAVAVGGSFFGLVGMLIAVPVSSVIYELLRRYANS